MRKLPLAAALLVASTIATDAYAWGDEGHKVVCEIALSQVKPSTRAAIVELIKATASSTASPTPAPGRTIRASGHRNIS